MKKRKYPIFDFIAALAFEFDVDWDGEYPPEEPEEIFAVPPLPKLQRQREPFGVPDAV